MEIAILILIIVIGMFALTIIPGYKYCQRCGAPPGTCPHYGSPSAYGP